MDIDICGQIYLLPIANIIPNLNQPRKDFNIDELAELSGSIKKNGVLQPITVRRHNGGFEIVSGERRFRACIMAGFDTIPAIITECSDERTAIYSLTENIQRKNLTFLEEAAAIYELLDKYDYGIDNIAVLLGRDPQDISNRLMLMKLSPEIRKKIEMSRISEEYARILSELDDNNIIECVLNTINTRNITVEETIELVNRLREVQNGRIRKKTVMVFKDLRLFINTLNHTVDTMNNSGIKAQKEQRETENYIEYTVRIPKNNTSVVKSC